MTILSSSRVQRSRWYAIASVLLLVSAACGDDTATGGGGAGGGGNDTGGGGEGAVGGGGSDTGGGNTGGGGSDTGGGGSNTGGGGMNEGGGGAPAMAPMITAPVSPLDDLTMGTPAVALFFEATGTDPITWEVTSGALPDGMTLDSATGEYLGTPTEPGDYAFTVTATNDAGTDEESYLQVVLEPAFDAHVIRTGGVIARFSALYPEGVDAPKTLTGIVAGDVIETMDRRPLNGWLYGLARNPLTPGSVRLYAIHPASGVASPIGANAVSLTSSVGLPILNVGRTEIDFNPTVDRIRVVTDIGLNFRMNPANGAIVDTDMNVVGAQPDGAINGAVEEIEAAAYTNSVQSTTVTTLYTATASLVTDQLFIQTPPNNGTQTAAATLPIALDSLHGFDMSPSVLAPMSNMPAPGTANAIFTMGAMQQWASIDLATGTMNVREAPGTNALGFALNQPAAAPFVALTANGMVLRFTGGDLATVTTVGLGAVQNNESIVGIDFRPETGQLYALGINSNTDTGTLYTLDAVSGALTAVGNPGGVAFAGTDLPAGGYSIDFNPMVDRLRVMTSNGLNFRVNPLNGAAVDSDMAVAGINPDAVINGGGITNVNAVAYTNSTGQGLTSLYALNATTGRLYLSSAPNAGTFAEIAQVTLGGAPLAFGAQAAVDIQVHVRTAVANGPVTEGAVWAALDVAGETHLYAIDLVTGVATDLGEIGADLDIIGLAIGQSATE